MYFKKNMYLVVLWGFLWEASLYLLPLLRVMRNAYSKYDSRSRVWRGKGVWITLTKNVTVVQIKNTVPRYKSHEVAEYTVDKGAYLKLDHWGTDYSWVLNSKPFKSNSHYTYVVKKR